MKRAFTLIELLIVVAIIAILAAIAVPNFLEAQTRSKVSRVASEFRSLSLALEAYRIDTNGYPASYREKVIPINSTLSHMDRRLVTTPIAYITDFPLDVFHSGKGAGVQAITGTTRQYCIYTTRYDGEAPASYAETAYPRNAFYAWTEGPDQELNSLAWETLKRVIANEAKGFDANPRGGIRYDPTNGTVSVGDIYLFGGEATWRPL